MNKPIVVSDIGDHEFSPVVRQLRPDVITRCILTFPLGRGGLF